MNGIFKRIVNNASAGIPLAQPLSDVPAFTDAALIGRGRMDDGAVLL
jgi:hypothetical protein